MKNPSDLTEADQIDSSSSAPQPFNLFAGLSEEQLPDTAAQTNVSAKLIPPAQPQRVAESVPNRSAAVYWTIAVIALLIALVFAFL